MKETVLVVEDEVDVADLLRYNLHKEGYNVILAGTGIQGLEMASQHRPDAILLDLMLPGMNGLEVCRKLRQENELKDVAVLILTAKGETSERVKGLETGADDYVTKPFSPKELILRLKAVLRRVRAAGKGDIIEMEGLMINKQSFEVRVNGHRLDLTTIEFKLLALLVERRGRVQTRESLLYDVWGYNNAIDTRTVDTHIRRLREKLGDHSSKLETVRGEGYRFLAV